MIVVLVVPGSFTARWLKEHLNLTSVTSAKHRMNVLLLCCLSTLSPANIIQCRRQMRKRGWSNGGMTLTGGNWGIHGKICPAATLFTTDPTWISLGSNPNLRDATIMTNRLGHNMAHQILRSCDRAASWHVTVHRDMWPCCIVTCDCASWHVTVLHRNKFLCNETK